jgi:antitoxin ParD1/3/4
VGEALRLLEERERSRELRLKELRRDIEEGIDSGPPEDGEPVFERMLAKYEAMAHDHRD